MKIFTLKHVIKSGLILSFLIFSIIPAYSLTNEQKCIKDNAYQAIAQALFANNTYDKYRVSIIETIGRLAVPDDQGYNIDSYKNALIDDTLKKMLSSVSKKVINNNAQQKISDKDIKEKLNRIKNKDDATIAYILAEALRDDDLSVQLYAASSLIKVREKTAIPLFVELLDSDKTQHKIIGLTVLPYLDVKKSIPQIVNIINDKKLKIKIRLIAFNALKRINEEAAKDTALDLIDCDNDHLSNEAIIFLAAKDNNIGLEKYIALLQSDKSKKQALENLSVVVENQQEKSLSLLTDLYKNGDVFAKMMVISAISKLNNQIPFIELLKESIESDNINIKLIAINTIANSKDDKIIELLDNLDFNNSEYLTKATALLITANNDLLNPLLIKILEKDNDFVKLGVSSYFIAKKQNTKLAEETLESLFNNKNETIKYRAAFILNKEDNIKANEIIISLLNSEDPTYKAKAIISLAEKADKTVIPYLVKAIENNDNDPQKAYGAALILHSLGNDHYINILTQYLSRSNIDVINNKYVNPELFTTFLDNENPWIRINAANSLLALDKNNQKALKTITDTLETDNITILSKSLSIIGQYGDLNEVPLVEKYLDDESVRVRVSASEALIRIFNRIDNTKPGAKDA